ncbi:MAG TPA: hypothetical protein VHC18_22275 [Amycolatopsis sp.]|nr:hypothetical protein [Amycolatopsis sp.]
MSWYPGAETGYTALAAHDVQSAPQLLSALARDFANNPRLTAYGQSSTGEPNMQDFLVLWLPVWLNELMSGTASQTYGLDPSRPADMAKILWLTHVAGYYGGVWLRKVFLDSDIPVHAGVPFTNTGIDAFYTNFIDKIRTVAAAGGGDAVLQAARSTVRSDLVATPSGLDSATVVSQILPPTDNLGGFGYDSAWLQDILPPGLDSPTNATPRVDNLFTHNPNLLLDAHYGLGELPYLARARDAYGAMAASTGDVAARYQQVVNGRLGELPLPLAQQRFTLYGSLVYGIGLPAASNYRGFNQDQYDRVLTWASYAVMGNQANAMNAISAYSTKNVTAARAELRSTLVWASYVGAYGWGHLNPQITSDQPMSTLLPKFTRDCGS